MNDSGFIAHKMRVHLNNKQSTWMRAHGVACNKAYNYAIDKLRNSNKDDKDSFPSPAKVGVQWTKDRDALYPWFKEQNLDLDTISNAIVLRYGAAINQWKISKWSKDKVPRFTPSTEKISVTMRGRKVKQIDAKTFALPKKMGTFRLGCPLRFKGDVRSVTFSFQGGKWYAAFLIKPSETISVPEPAPLDTRVGIDVGVAQFATLSTGEQYPSGFDYNAELAKLAKLQREHARMVKRSKNWNKHKIKIAAQHRRIANMRRHYSEVVSKDIAERYQLIAIEDLRVANMTKSAKGTAAAPGKRVAQKSGLNRSILNSSFYMFRTRLEAKAYQRGGQVVAVNAAYTSQTCAACGFASKENRKTQADFECIECGHTNNADINAAQNILHRALCPAPAPTA